MTRGSGDKTTTWRSWGNFPQLEHHLAPLGWRDASLPDALAGLPPGDTVLAVGLGRSYGDSCQNADGTLLTTRGLDRFIALDEANGRLRCEAGVSLAEVLDLIVPRGFFLPVTPGTKFVTVGGAVANDVHGKNHHRDGTFGHAVTALELQRSSGERLVLTPESNAPLLRATIGGLGLTGLIMWVEFRLKRIPGPLIDQETIKFGSLDGFFRLSAESARFTYSVAWIDCLARGRSLGRGLFFRGEHAASVGPTAKRRAKPPLLVPFMLPTATLNGLSVKLFNTAIYGKQWRPVQRGVIPYAPFFYPLDAIGHWNRIYGKRGFYQFQCVIPSSLSPDVVARLLETIAAARMGSFLAVLKIFGDAPPAGLLSFPREGATLALDFPNTGAPVRALLAKLEAITLAAGGAIYPAKDAAMSVAAFRQSFPRWSEMTPFLDPRFSSSFWRRVHDGRAA